MLFDLTQYLWIVWLVFVLLFIIIELLTLEFTFLMIGTGSLIGGLGANLLGAPWWAQVGAAAILTALLLFTIRPLLLRAIKPSTPEYTNVDALVGLHARVVSPFSADGAGSVKLVNGETWTARLVGGIGATAPGLDIGDPVTVARIDGAIAEVAPLLREDS